MREGLARIATEVALWFEGRRCYDKGMFKLKSVLVCEGQQRSISWIGTDRSPCAGLILVRLRMQGQSHSRPPRTSKEIETPNLMNCMKKFMSAKTALLIATLLLTCSVQAGSHTWSGANGTLFNNASNWSYGGAPTNGEQNVYLYFPAGAVNYTCSNNITGLTVTGITISGDNYGLIGKPISCAAGAYVSVSGNADYISAPFQLAGHDLTFTVSSNVTFYSSGAISGSGNVIKAGAGSMKLVGLEASTYTGTFYVNAGTVIPSMGIGYNLTFPGPLVIGTSVGTAGTAFVKYGSDSQVSTNSTVTVNYTGVMDLNGYSEWLYGLIMAGGTIQSGTGTLHMVGNMTVQAGAASITGKLSFYGTNRTINAVAGGTLNVYASVDSYVYNPGIIKTGAGAVNLYASNTYSGPTIVTQGYLGVGNPNALGANNLTITNSGIVQLMGVSVTNLTATISGNGNGNGAIRAFGTNVVNGYINLAANAGIQSLGSNDVLMLDANISGPGGLTKLGAGKVVIGGFANNSYQGTTTVAEGTLELDKSNNVAIPSALIIGDATNSVNSRVVRLKKANQIADTSSVAINHSGLLEVGDAIGVGDTVGSLTGNGNVNLGWDGLTIGGDNLDSQFAGSFSGWGLSKLIKQGTGTLTLNGNSPNWVGAFLIQGGKVSLNGSMPSAAVNVSSNSVLAGNGVTGPIYSTVAKLTPGNSAGVLYTANLTLTTNTVLEMELNGNNAGVDYDQVSVSGTVELGNSSLSIVRGFQGNVGDQFVIIKNDASDSVAGTFKNLPEGAVTTVGDVQFQITYHGGDGNDVVLTQTTLPQPPKIAGITPGQNGQMQLQGTGLPGSVYGVEANTNLSTTNWIAIGYSIADQSGNVSFTDTNAPNYSMRFYRLILK